MYAVCRLLAVIPTLSRSVSRSLVWSFDRSFDRLVVRLVVWSFVYSVSHWAGMRMWKINNPSVRPSIIHHSMNQSLNSQFCSAWRPLLNSHSHSHSLTFILIVGIHSSLVGGWTWDVGRTW